MKMNYVEKNLEKMVRNFKDLYEALYYSINFLFFILLSFQLKVWKENFKSENERWRAKSKN